MKSIWKILTAGALALAATGAWAHGAGVHAKGTVKSVSAERLVVQTEEGEKAFQLGAATKFTKGRAPGAAADLRPGDRVVVHAKQGKGTLDATEVRIGAQPGAEHAH